MILDLFLVFLKLGTFTFGGGYAMVPLMQSDIVDKRKWITQEEFIDIIAISQATPGAFAVNVACFIGYKKNKISGAIFAILGCIFPAFISTLTIAIFFDSFMKLKIIQKIFMGIRPAVSALIVFSVYTLIKGNNLKVPWYIISIISFVGIVYLKFDPILLIIFSSILGIIISGRGQRNDFN